MKNFLLIGAAGYIAPRHMKAIRETGNNLLAALDPHDSVGILDTYFPDCHFFTEFERFDRHCDKLKRAGVKIDYVVVCSPNYLHDAHIRFGLRISADVICEKPVVLNPWNVDALQKLESETGKNIYTIFQLRHHPVILMLKEKFGIPRIGSIKHKVKLTYITPRGYWYLYSWKGDLSKSGGIATNIGLHFFDMLMWIFGSVKKNNVIYHKEKSAQGVLELEFAEVEWQLSIEKSHLPSVEGDCKALRLLEIDGIEYDFSNGFDGLHSVTYKEILNGSGVKLNECRSVIQLSHEIRSFHKIH